MSAWQRPWHDHIDGAKSVAEAERVSALRERAMLDADARAAIGRRAVRWVEQIRARHDAGLMEIFLAEYGLSTEEGIALMSLAEALLRVPDAATIDALIEDKIAHGDWQRHLGRSPSTLVNTASIGLLITGRLLDDGAPARSAAGLRKLVKRLGQPAIRTAVAAAMAQMGRQFVLGETITGAMTRAKHYEQRGYTFSYDMLGEAARTAEAAHAYRKAYELAIEAIAGRCQASVPFHDNPGISIKLSALHPRYEEAQRERCMRELVPTVLDLALRARAANMGLSIDAEEQDRLSLSLDIIAAVLSDPRLAGWDGFGVVVQAYGLRADHVIDELYALATQFDRRLAVRLVKGAYWDAEVKLAQVEGLQHFPVFTRKAATDISYLANCRTLLNYRDRLYPQFATHNAHTVASILHMADGSRDFEFQRLHGMGESLYALLHDEFAGEEALRCRVYAPVGQHEDLLAYLVRRLLENGANSSFVNQMVDPTIPPETVVADPYEQLDFGHHLSSGSQLYGQYRRNARGFDLTDRALLAWLEQNRASFRSHQWLAQPLLAATPVDDLLGCGERAVYNPARRDERVGLVREANAQIAQQAVAAARPWKLTASERSDVLNKVADRYEARAGEIFALLTLEAGKTIPDAVAELREAVDFLRYYAAQAADLSSEQEALGTIVCISPWNFPLAIFTGQIAAALAAGNAVIAKPAEQTALIGQLAIECCFDAGVPRTALQYVPGTGADVGAALSAAASVAGVAFTGSTATARRIQHTMADNLKPGAVFIAETGGLNAMIVDSTALPEQAVVAVMESAFQSAGQRCSALRCLYVQDDIADDFIAMLKGAMDEWTVGDPWSLATDCGPVIDDAAQAKILEHIAVAEQQGRLLHQVPVPECGYFVPPSVLALGSINELAEEVFGPVLHLCRFKADQLQQVVTDINASGYGLTFGVQTRITRRAAWLAEKVHVGNVYINRNQVGAIVGCQPFGGEGLSGTGPKAGGPHYLPRFTKARASRVIATEFEMAGPTGETNTLRLVSRAPVFCCGPGADLAQQQANRVRQLGGSAVVLDTPPEPEALTGANGISAVLWWGDEDRGRAYARALAQREGAIVPLICGEPDVAHVCHERHICEDTTASGGNATLLAGSA